VQVNEAAVKRLRRGFAGAAGGALARLCGI